MSADLQKPPQMKGTLGLTGLTMNAMALIAPGAFLWLTYAQQAQYGAPMAGSDMWFGIIAALALCFATAISYAELSKLYPGAGSSYFFAEQAFLSKTHAYKFARVAKFITGWSSHLYYWVYPGVMVGVTALLVGYLAAQLFPDTFNSSLNSPLLMIVFCVIFSFGVAYIAYRGVTGTTAVNVAINVIQISALLIFAVMAIGYRSSHPEGSEGWALVDGKAAKVRPVYKMKDKLDDAGKTIPKMEDGKPVLEDGKPVMEQEQVTDDKGNPVQETDAKGELVFEPVDKVSYKDDITKEPIDPKDESKGKRDTRQCFATAGDVVKPHGFSFIIIQACIAILILVGFESVTAMGEEAKNAKRDIPRAVLLSLFVQGVICYLIEYFAANYFLHNNYKMTDGAGSGAPIGDMMQLVGAWAFGSPEAGRIFMLVQAFTVFLALIGTTLSCMNTGARVTYAMGRDDEVPSHFGLLHGKNLTPHRAIWTLAAISAVIGIFAVYFYACGPFVSDVEAAQKNVVTIREMNSPWYSFGIFDAETAQKIPNGLLVVTLVSNFGTFLLYMLTNIVAIVAFREHHMFNGIKHMVIPVFGLLANLVCMLFYLIGPMGIVENMSWKEPYVALAFAAVWAVYGWWYFVSSSKAKGRSTLITKTPAYSVAAK